MVPQSFLKNLYYRSDSYFNPVPELASFDAGAEHNMFFLEII